MDRRQAIVSSCAALLTQTGFAQSWPSKPIRIIVPFTPGGTTDFVSRLVAAELQKQLGQAVLVENKPGAGTVIGVDHVAKSPADGYTLICVANSFAVNQSLVKNFLTTAQKISSQLRSWACPSMC